MATKRAAPAPKPEPKISLAPGETGSMMRAIYESHLYRFLLADGTTLDVLAHRDDSDLRAAVLAHTGAERIAGVTQVDGAQGA